jgi:peroxiredoxin Q/BCP
LLSDPELGVHKAFGAYGTKKLYGREYQGVLRSTFVLDEKGVVTLALYNVKATGHVEMLRKLLGL